jgi:hypothetical protein
MAMLEKARECGRGSRCDRCDGALVSTAVRLRRGAERARGTGRRPLVDDEHSKP